MFPLLLIFFQFSQFSLAQQIIPLNTFKGGNVNTKINAVPPYALYVSAHMDTSIVLKNIYVKTDGNQMMSIDDIKNSKADSKSGLLTPFQIQSTAYVSSSLDDNQMAALEGFIYITTAKQANTFNFKVYDVDQAQVVRTLICDPCTLVFLNSNTQMTPVQSSTISTWRQSDDSVIKMYQGVPTDDVEVPNSQLFANPIETITGPPQLIPTVEKFSISLGAFYFKATKDFYFLIQPYYNDNNGVYTTTGYHSTGLVSKSKTQIPKTVSVICIRDTRFNGTTGANIVGWMPTQDGKVTVQENDGVDNVHITVAPANQIFGWSTNTIGQNITISSESSEGGEFYVQYYVTQGQQISSSFAPTIGTTQFVETTTKGAGVVSSWIIVCCLLSFLVL